MQTPDEDWEAQYRKPLTARQVEVLQCFADGHTSNEVRDMLGISMHTVQAHVFNACERLGARSREQLVIKAWAAGIVRVNGHAMPARS